MWVKCVRCNGYKFLYPVSRYICEIDDLKVKLELTLQELAKTKHKVEELNSEKISLVESVKRMEQLVQESEKIKVQFEDHKTESCSVSIFGYLTQDSAP